MRKPLVFSSVIGVLIISIVLGIFIKQKIQWNNWETQQLLLHQKKIKKLVDAIEIIEFDLQKEESKKSDLNRENNKYKENIFKLEEIIKKHNEEIKRLDEKSTPYRKVIKLLSLSGKSGKLKQQIKTTKDEIIKSIGYISTPNKYRDKERVDLMIHVLLTKQILKSHYEKISEYIYIRNDIETKINKHKKDREQKSEKLEKFQTEISKNNKLLEEIIISIKKLKETLNNKKNELLALQNKNY